MEGSGLFWAVGKVREGLSGYGEGADVREEKAKMVQSSWEFFRRLSSSAMGAIRGVGVAD